MAELIQMQKNFLQLIFHCNKKGQVLPYFLIMSIILIISWAMLINIAKVIRDRMILQNKLDNAVMSVANLQARTLNLLGVTNYLIATVLSTSSYPMLAMFPTFSTEQVGGSLIPGPFCDYKCTGGFHTSTQFSGVKRIKQIVNSIQKTQDIIINSYIVNYVALPSRFFKNIRNFSLNSVDPKILLGIKRNKKEIIYYKTLNVCADFKAKHYHIVYPKYYMKDKYSWYIQDENFYDKKIVGVANRKYNSNDNYPVFSKLLDINMPDLYAVSSAGLYNAKGAMFSDKEAFDTGLSYTTVAFLSPMIARQIKTFYDIIEASASIPVLGEILATAEVVYGLYYLEQLTEKIITQPKNKNTPIYKYNEAEFGGWDAHLVPLKNNNS